MNIKIGDMVACVISRLVEGEYKSFVIPGDIVQYGFGTLRGNKFSNHNIVCVVNRVEEEDRYNCLFMSGDYRFNDALKIKLEYFCTDTDLVSTFNINLHTKKVKKL